MRRSTRIDGSAGGEPLSCGNQSTYNRVANAGNLHRLSPFQMPFGILHNLTGKSSLTFSIEKCHFITAIIFPLLHICRRLALTYAVQPIALAIVASTMVAAIKAHRLRAVVRPAVFLPGRNGFFQTHVITPLAALNNDFQIYYNTSSKRMI